MNQIQEDFDRLICKLCNKSFKSKDTLKNHLKFTHGDEKVSCEVCHKQLANKISLYHLNEKASLSSANIPGVKLKYGS